jgi:hypothetical protein
MENRFYKTRDLGESAALLLSNAHLVNFAREGKIVWFYFEDAAIYKKLSDEYFFGQIKVNARDFYQAMTKLKNRIFSIK